MELLYLYIERYGDIFDSVSLNFGSEKEVDFDENRNLFIRNRKYSAKGFYGDNILNISAFFGKNGAGKSTLMDILGMKWADRTRSKDEVNYNYFMIYHVKGDLYAFEFSNTDFFKNLAINNLQIDCRASIYPYKDYLGLCFEYYNSKIQMKSQVIKSYLEFNKIDQQLYYFYLNLSDHSHRIMDKEYDKRDYMFKRNYSYDRISYNQIYLYLEESNKKGNIHYINKQIVIELKNVKSIIFHDFYLILEDYFSMDNEKSTISIYDLENDNNEINCSIRTKDDFKRDFLNKFKFNAIKLYYFLATGFILKLEEKSLDVNKLEKLLEEDNGRSQISIFDTQMQITDVQTECERFVALCKLCEFDLDKILPYIFQRYKGIMKSIDLGGNDEEYFYVLYEEIKMLSELYFEENASIVITPNQTHHSEVKKLLNLIDKYKVFTESQDDYVNSVRDLYDIRLTEMSDGERVYLNIMTQIATSLRQCKKGDTAILLIDEPDSKLHPEWSRCFVSYMIDEIKKVEDINVQIIITSHSLFIASDILNQNAYCISYENHKRVVKNNIKTFANNIFSLFSETFMLSSFYGEFASNKIKAIMSDLKNIQSDTELKSEDLNILLENIGEEILLNKLKQLHARYILKKQGNEELLKRIFIEQDENKIKKIREILDDKN